MRRSKRKLRTTFVPASPRVYEKYLSNGKRTKGGDRLPVYGYAYTDTNKIEIDPRQSTKEYLDTLIHEMLHCFFPNLDEKHIRRTASKIARQIWNRRYRVKQLGSGKRSKN